ncbi:hypothetical protein KIPB_012518 [Kipferlia bialata]|uniref:Uncharacterized protein n=1 Tax=Kipferlia bialata TaxID=797122 RepID=A0A9K3D6Q8_9EUKA|nr:hypothetical protein KIPB_012518 [Kipferlia bialata]|eukprot:g12518.t1
MQGDLFPTLGVSRLDIDQPRPSTFRDATVIPKTKTLTFRRPETTRAPEPSREDKHVTQPYHQPGQYASVGSVAASGSDYPSSFGGEAHWKSGHPPPIQSLRAFNHSQVPSSQEAARVPQYKPPTVTTLYSNTSDRDKEREREGESMSLADRMFRFSGHVAPSKDDGLTHHVIYGSARRQTGYSHPEDGGLVTRGVTKRERRERESSGYQRGRSASVDMSPAPPRPPTFNIPPPSPAPVHYVSSIPAAPKEVEAALAQVGEPPASAKKPAKRNRTYRRVTPSQSQVHTYVYIYIRSRLSLN